MENEKELLEWPERRKCITTLGKHTYEIALASNKYFVVNADKFEDKGNFLKFYVNVEIRCEELDGGSEIRYEPVLKAAIHHSQILFFYEDIDPTRDGYI